MIKFNIKINPLINIFIVLFITQTLHQIVFGNICHKKETCGECISEHPSCVWCSQEEFSKNGAERCNTLEKIKGKCDNAKIVSPEETIDLIKDMSLSNIGAKESEAIQLKPQEIKIRLRPNSIQKFKIEFQQAVDYPVDLYYLMDLSSSMRDDRNKLSELGDKLADEMESITNNFKMGFGSFVDKTVFPFDAQYSFLNNMPLSTETREFAEKVRNATISGNLDDPEGGFDALMQAIVCQEDIGWRNKSRKLLVFSTDEVSHMAGDGKLGGVIEPNDELCHLDEQGYYTKSGELDYPSLSQINKQIREHNMNIIFAVTSDQVKLYESLSAKLKGSSTGELDKDSANVVDLIRDRYNEIRSEVEMADDVVDNNIRISYYSSCLGNKIEKTNICRGLQVGTKVTFEVNLEYVWDPQNKNDWNRTFNIFPVGLQDYLTVNLEILHECDCEKPWNEEKFSAKCSDGNGTFECGICTCSQQRYGKECECDASDVDPFMAVKSCLNGNDTIPCSGQGSCKCGRCYCHSRQIPNQRIYGTYCECDNFKCDEINGKVCSGPDHGSCDCGSCRCLAGWVGDDCACSDSKETCMGPNGEICSGHGTCECGNCQCNNTGGQNYFGIYCDDCSSCPGMCGELRECVECLMEEQKGLYVNCSVCGIVSQNFFVDSIEVKEKEKPCTFEDKENCKFSFKYAFDEEKQLLVWIQRKRECPVPIDIVAIVAGVIGGILATGIFLLMLFKTLTVIHDRRELAKFEKERLSAKWNKATNPLYKEVHITYENPAYKECGQSALSNPLTTSET